MTDIIKAAMLYSIFIVGIYAFVVLALVMGMQEVYF
ncbi:hypothetical protein ABID39_001208 [Bartonella japonica]|uniref:Potassium-transporting ATPase subunit F n=1 Tax=Bartonella japonica TaxID=357761 RepID=A0ABV2FPK8_9HYPH